MRRLSYFLHFLCFLEPDRDRDRDFLECFLDLDFLWHRLRTFFRDTDLPWDRSLLRSFTPMHFLAASRAEPSPFLNRYGLPAAMSFRIAADFLDPDFDDFAMEPGGEVIHAMSTIVCLLKRVAVARTNGALHVLARVAPPNHLQNFVHGMKYKCLCADFNTKCPRLQLAPHKQRTRWRPPGM
jgi:hypothetical protein